MNVQCIIILYYIDSSYHCLGPCLGATNCNELNLTYPEVGNLFLTKVRFFFHSLFQRLPPRFFRILLIFMIEKAKII